MRILIIFFSFISIFANEQEILKIFSQRGYFDKNLHAFGEVKQSELYVGDEYEVSIEKLEQNAEFEIYSLGLNHKYGGDSVDIYVYAKGKEIHKIRSLAQIYMIREMVRGYDILDEAIKKDIDIENLKLIVTRDRELAEFGAKNAYKFEEIFTLYNKNLDYKNQLKKLHLDYAYIDKNGLFVLVVGGVTDNVVSFLRTSSDNLPNIDGHNFIMIKKVVPHWYLFKTT